MKNIFFAAATWQVLSTVATAHFFSGEIIFSGAHRILLII